MTFNEIPHKFCSESFIQKGMRIRFKQLVQLWLLIVSQCVAEIFQLSAYRRIPVKSISLTHSLNSNSNAYPI